MISNQAKIKREELVDGYDYSHLSEKQSYKDGFDAGYEFAKSEAVEEIELLNSLNQMLKEKLTIIRSFGDNTTFAIADAAIKAAEKMTK